jgi:hypothetical protein
MRILDEIKSGKRTLAISLYRFQQELEYVECRTIEEARELLARPLVEGHRRSLSPWQWVDENGDDEFQPWSPEVEEVEQAVYATV